MTDQRELENAGLEIANRHLDYVLGDTLSASARELKLAIVHNFYAAIYGNLGMHAAARKWEENVADKGDMSPVSERKDKSYCLTDVLKNFGVEDNALVFQVLEVAGDELRIENEGNACFYVGAVGIEKIFNYLRRNGCLRPSAMGGAFR